EGLGDEVGLGLLEGADELAADDLALGLRVADPGERVEELLTGVDGDEAHGGCGDVVLFDLAAFVLPQEPVIDEDADELVPDRFVNESSGDSRVDSTGETADDLARTDLRTDAPDLLGDDVARIPVGGDPRGAVEEVLENVLPV